MGQKNNKNLNEMLTDEPEAVKVKPKAVNTNQFNIDETDVKKIKVNMLLSETEHLMFTLYCKKHKTKIQDMLKEIALEWMENQPKLGIQI